MNLSFEPSSPFSLGAELELQLVDRGTLELSSSSIQILKAMNNPSNVAAELYQSMIEITTGVCGNAFEIGGELSAALAKVASVCDRFGLDLVSAGTHPWARHQDAVSFPRARFDEVLDRRKWIAKRLLVFGLHVHVGMHSGDHAIRTMNALMKHLPMLLAFSASSPFSGGEDTHLESARSTFFEAFPTGGPPLPLKDWREFQDIYSRMIASGAIESPKDLWWDVRPSPAFGTLEFRICDSPATLREATAIVAWIHLLCVAAERDFQKGRPAAPASPWILRENKWRAIRDGVSAELIEDEIGRSRPISLIFEDEVKRLRELVDHFAYAPHIDVLRQVLHQGSSSERQRQVYESSNGDLRPVIAVLIEELDKDRPLWLSDKKKGKGKCA